MYLKELIAALQQAHDSTGFTLHRPSSPEDLQKARLKLGTDLPNDLQELYSICDGFRCEKDQFTFNGAKHLFRDNEYGHGCIIFADHHVYTDVWAIRILNAESYEITYNDEEELVLTNSLTEFLERLLQGHLYEKGGLYAWHDEVKQRPGRPSQ